MKLDGLALSARGDGVRIGVQVKPRSSKSAIAAVKDGQLVVALRAPPVEGAANEELVRLLAAALGVRRADVVIAVGGASKRKLVDVRGLDAAALRAKLEAL